MLRTFYLNAVCRIAGQDYCRHHIIKAAVNADVITEIKPGRSSGEQSLRPRLTSPTGADQMYAITLQ